MRGKVAQKWRLVGETHAWDRLAMLPDYENDFDHIVNVALGVDATRDGQPHQIHFCGAGKHEGADLDRADSAFEIKFGGQCSAGKLVRRDVGQEGAGIEIDGMT